MKYSTSHFRGSAEKKSAEKLGIYESHMGSKQQAPIDFGPKRLNAYSRIRSYLLILLLIVLFSSVLYFIALIPGPELWEQTGLKKYTGSLIFYFLLFFYLILVST